MLHFALGRGRRRFVALLAVMGLSALSTAHAAPPINTLEAGILGGRSEVAILGYDPVAYFAAGKPMQGDARLAHRWQGATWQFASQANLDKFQADPARWAPQYGGYCAYGVAKGNLVSVEPDKFTVRDGKLYLNYNADIQAAWLKDPAGFIQQADARFEALLKQ